jgi:hypothetical protein
LPEWVSQELIVADAGAGREIIASKLAEWKYDMGSGTVLDCDQKSLTSAIDYNQSARSKAAGKKKDKRENLRDLAKKLGAKRVQEKRL